MQLSSVACRRAPRSNQPQVCSPCTPEADSLRPAKLPNNARSSCLPRSLGSRLLLLRAAPELQNAEAGDESWRRPSPSAGRRGSPASVSQFTWLEAPVPGGAAVALCLPQRAAHINILRGPPRPSTLLRRHAA